jgi:glycine betaine/proline transport system permease protein
MTQMAMPRAAVATRPRVTVKRWQMALFGLVVLIVLQMVVGRRSPFPDSWNIHLARPIKTFQTWARVNRNDNFVLAHVLRPIGDFVLWFYNSLLDILNSLPWFWPPLAAALIIARSGRWVLALSAALGLTFVEVSGFHEAGMETIALMLICVLLAVAIGGPLGIWAGLSPRVERRLRPVLDALQSLPTTIYLVPAVLFFGILQTPAAIATVAFGIPPMIRIAALGIRQVPTASVEAGEMFGSSRWQLLWKVQAPQAAASFVTAINQTIMLCLSMVVIGSLVGAGGLGNELLQTLRLRSPGRGFMVGLAIFGIAVAFDRLSRSLMDRSTPLPIPARRYWMATAGILVVAYIIGKFGSLGTVPFKLDRNIAQPIDTFTEWVRDHFGGVLRSVNDFVVRDVVIRLREFLGITVAWPILVVAVAGLAWLVKSWKLAVFCAAALVTIGLVGMWQPALETLAQLVVAVVLSLLIALPLGIFVGRRPRVEAIISPALDALQTFPSLIYAIPFVMVFAVGYVPGILATVIYAVPPGIRLTALAIKQVSPETLEAASTFGATDRQRLWGVQVPLALKGIALGVNQVIMMAVSMVIIAGLVGGQGLGFLAVSALITQNVGQGVEVGLAMLLMAIMLDRLSEGVAHRMDPARGLTTSH